MVLALENKRSTPAEDAGSARNCRAILARFGNMCACSFHHPSRSKSLSVTIYRETKINLNLHRHTKHRLVLKSLGCHVLIIILRLIVRIKEVCGSTSRDLGLLCILSETRRPAARPASRGAGPSTSSSVLLCGNTARHLGPLAK